MLGEKDCPGVLPCAIRDIFNHIEQEKDKADYRVWISYLEVYNESVSDLFNKEKNNLKLVNSERVSTGVNS